MNLVKLKKNNRELLDQLTPETQKNFIRANPKIMNCVLLSDILLDSTYYANSINDIVENTTKRCKTGTEIGLISQHNFTPNNEDKIANSEELDEFTIEGMIYDKTFPTLNTAIQYIQDAKTWSLVSTGRVINTNSTMNHYRCDLESETGIACPVKKYLLIETNSLAILYRSKEPHNHKTIDQIFEFDSCIELSDEDEENSMPSCNTVEMWLSSIAEIPRYDDTVYCVDYFIDRYLKKIRFFLSTRKLLKLVLESRSIHVSSVETIQWRKNQVILVGTTDFDRKFHNFGLMVCCSKTASDYEFIFNSIKKGVTECFPDKILTIDTLVSDCNPNIQNAFKYVFGNAAKTVTSLSDFSYKISKLFEKNNCNGLIEDIIKLQLLPSTNVFNTGVQLFLKKWALKDIEQFKIQWLDKNCNWYEGYSYCTPSNTAVLQEYEKFRKAYLYKTLDSLDLFLDQLFVAVRNWSNVYNNGYRNAVKAHIATEIPQILQLACRWLRTPKNIEIEKTDTETFYYLNSDLRRCFDNKLFRIYRGLDCSRTLDNFFAIRSKYCTVRKNQQNVITCDCADFFKHLSCQHSIGVGYLLNLYKIPLSIIPDPSQIPYYLTLN